MKCIVCAYLVIFVFLGLATSLPKVQAAEPATYYVDCGTGNDANLGTDPTTAWKSIPRVNTAVLSPGDSVVFKRGCTWTDTTRGNFLLASWDGTDAAPITIGAYGMGQLPIIQADAQGTSNYQVLIDITGSNLVLEDIHTRVINHYREPTCLQADGSGVRLGWYVGFSVSSSHNILRNIETDGLSLAVNLGDNSDHNKILNAHIHDLNALWRIDKVNNALGALGVNLHGDDNEVGYSLFERNWAQCNYIDDGQDQNYSAPFEIYNANRSFVHHNRAFEHRKHYEMGKVPSETSTGNILAYNLFVSSRVNAKGPNIHGSSNPFGPINNTEIYNNTMIFTGSGSEGIICSCDGGAILRNNIFAGEAKAAFYSGSFTEDHNLYWDYGSSNPLVQFITGNLSSTSVKLNPLLASDYRPTAASPVVDAGANLGLFNSDLNDMSVPIGVRLDIGAYEYFSWPSFAIWTSSYGQNSAGDYNRDNLTNSLDFATWLLNSGQ